ncbi:MAG: hypothetical protein K6B41_09490 [Butyrivibrio sp.]|nr:hypothetical protein [Butyrivibrio sp.]
MGEEKANENTNIDESISTPNAEVLEVAGFLFKTKEDVQKANVDLKKIIYLEKKVNPSKPSDMKAVYEKAIANKIFSTPVGWEYLILLRDKMTDAGVSLVELSPIPMDISFSKAPLPDDYVVKQRIKPEKPKKQKPKFSIVISILFNIIMAILVILMFVVAYFSETDNILNYKRNVTNRYAEWTQSLTERERAVRQKERELGIEDNTNYLSEEDETSN